MVATQTTKRLRSVGSGWAMLLVVATLMGLNGVAWFFVGPDAMVSDMAESMDISVVALETSYPAVASDIAVNQYQMAIYLMAIGAMGFTAALAGFRGSERWAWRSTWVLVGIPVAIAATGWTVAGPGVGVFMAMMLLLALVALTGQLLAGKRNRQASVPPT